MEIVRMKVPIFTMAPIGSLEVYVLQSVEEINRNASYSGYYWRDAASPQGYGPFARICDAVEHYKSLILHMKGKKAGLIATKPKLEPVVRVDFKMKKKVDTDFL